MYKTHNELGISSAEHAALLKVKDVLADIPMPVNLESLDHVRRRAGVTNSPVKFNMIDAKAEYECGTAFCIGGFMKLAMLRKPFDAVTLTDDEVTGIRNYVYQSFGGLRELFFPPELVSYRSITQAQALQAIENFLTTGDPSWDAIP
jgi:hypothetical protein